MPRMSKKRKEEWAFFLNDRSRIAYNALCRKCVHNCKQSFRAMVIVCPHYCSKTIPPSTLIALWQREEVMHHLLQNRYPATAFRAVAPVYPSGRILDQCQTALCPAAGAHTALPEIRLGVGGWGCLCDLYHPADGERPEPERADGQGRIGRVGECGPHHPRPAGLEPGKPYFPQAAR